MKCSVCGSTNFRVSRFRTADIPRLLLFNFLSVAGNAVRAASQDIMFALNLRQARKARHLEEPRRRRAGTTSVETHRD